jgi:hypothetical protein
MSRQPNTQATPGRAFPVLLSHWPGVPALDRFGRLAAKR